MIRRPPRSTQSRSSAASDVYKRQAEIRGKIGHLGIGEVQIQEFGAPNAVLIRIASQPTEQEQQQSIARVKEALGEEVEYRLSLIHISEPTRLRRISYA